MSDEDIGTNKFILDPLTGETIPVAGKRFNDRLNQGFIYNGEDLVSMDEIAKIYPPQKSQSSRKNVDIDIPIIVPERLGKYIKLKNIYHKILQIV